MDKILIRNARIEDAERLSEIYAYYVKNTAVSFEYTAPGLEEFKSRIRVFSQKHPYLVVEKDGFVCGYAYAHDFIPRAAYAKCAEMTIYLDHSYQKSGYGKMLYLRLEEELKSMGITNLYACIGLPAEENDPYISHNSAEFHAHMGYTKVGVFHRCGYKFGRYYHMVYMEKIIST